jgi:glycerophosphoryl diester phosphodiesterase
VMVWTVNREREIRYWLSDHRADVLITDRPAVALALRDQTPTDQPRGDQARGGQLR